MYFYIFTQPSLKLWRAAFAFYHLYFSTYYINSFKKVGLPAVALAKAGIPKGI
jgi:hypothetical protein